MLFGSKKIVGLDIGTNSVKVAELDVSKNSATLQKFGILEAPPTSVSAGDIVDAGIYGDAVLSLLQNQKIKTKPTCAGMWGSSVIVKKISIPQMEKKFVAEQIRWEAEQYIPFDISEVNLDYAFLKESSAGYDNMDVLLVAARKEQIIKYVEIIETAGQVVSIIDVNGFALANCFTFNYGPAKDPVAVLNIGSQYTNFVVISGEDLIFCRDIPVGGQFYTVDIQKSLNVSLTEAESLKISASMGQMPEEIASVISSSHEIVCDEIQGSIDFFNNTTPGVEISKIYVTGGGSRTPGLIQQLGQATQREVELLNPFAKVKVGRGLGGDYINQVSDLAACAIGLGLRKEGDS
ncbi:MAG: fimbrial assembly protein [Bdellovibrionaceae bacterium]|nr:fimbrial assembly protein [Pseudobdellovibrionaceae bacterium]|tara:strand:- start:10711 stop:11757 length:1047 start_codon:yes stop_codon:yes gene_type:complete